jgi:polyisoprenoid-binding protein YceI
MRRHALPVVLALGLMLARPAGATEPRAGTLVLDPAKTLIEFRLPATLHTTHGTFTLTRGVIEADPRTGKAGGVVEIDAASGDSGIGMRDRTMKEKILETETYPSITFIPHHIQGQLEPDGDLQAKLQGDLTIHGSKHQMTIDANGHLSGDDLVVTCHFTVPYVEWGMKDPSLPLLTVSKFVDIDVATAGRVTWSKSSRASNR